LQVIAVARTSDLVMMVLDGGKEQVNRHREILEGELETVRSRREGHACTPPGIPTHSKLHVKVVILFE